MVGKMAGRRQPTDRGYVMLMVLLLMLALTAIGAISITSTASNISVAGANKVSNMAQVVATSGVEATMVMAAMNPGTFINYVTVNNGTIAMADFSADFYDRSNDGSGSFGRETTNVSNVFWQSRMTNAQMSGRAPGYQLGEQCFLRYTSYTDGTYGNQPNILDPADVGRNVERNALARDLATLYVGPISCP